MLGLSEPFDEESTILIITESHDLLTGLFKRVSTCFNVVIDAIEAG